MLPIWQVSWDMGINCWVHYTRLTFSWNGQKRDRSVVIHKVLFICFALLYLASVLSRVSLFSLGMPSTLTLFRLLWDSEYPICSSWWTKPSWISTMKSSSCNLSTEGLKSLMTFVKTSGCFSDHPLYFSELDILAFNSATEWARVEASLHYDRIKEALKHSFLHLEPQLLRTVATVNVTFTSAAKELTEALKGRVSSTVWTNLRRDLT